VGTNLFHSFGAFNIYEGQSATFTGPSSIENVLGRVTGGSSSFIDGLLRTQFENANPNLFLLNPAGVLFGPNASLDVQGSFHVSTADYLKLGDGGRFEATNPENSVLTVAPPEAFGFLGERQPAGIAVQGSRLQVPDGETPSVVGGDIRIADGSLYAPGGRIDMVSVASPGEVLPDASDLGVASFEQLGRIEVSHSSSSERPRVDPSLPRWFTGNVIYNVDASGEGGGRIFIRGGELVAEDNAFIVANTWGSGEGPGIDIGVTGQVTMRNGANIRAHTFSSGSGGDLIVETSNLEVRNGASINADNVTVTADRVFLSGVNPGSIPLSGSTCTSGCTGLFATRSIIVTAGNLEVRHGAVISVSAPPGPGGNVTVTADRVFLSGDFAGIFAIAIGVDQFEGRAGNITVTAGTLEVRNRARISARFSDLGLGHGEGGNVTINATDITLQDDGRISAEGIGDGTQVDAGNITLEVGNLLHLSNDSSITTSAAGGTGKGGNITLNSVFVVLDEGSIISSAVEGQGGNILIRILGGGALFQLPDSLIDASSEFGIDGAVVIDAPDTDIIAGFAGLPANFLDAATVLTQLCAGRSGANVSSLVVRKYEVLPDSPYALRVQLPRAIPTPRTAKQSRAPRAYYAGGPLPPMISCLGNG
jgi:filamentous hemagglutinin family protein